MAKLTPKQREVVQAMKRTDGWVSESWYTDTMERRGKREVLYLDDGVYTVALYVHKRTFESLLKKGVIQFEPSMTETRDNWMRAWYCLKDKY